MPSIINCVQHSRDFAVIMILNVDFTGKTFLKKKTHKTAGAMFCSSLNVKGERPYYISYTSSNKFSLARAAAVVQLN